jgi:hypothetical protein
MAQLCAVHKLGETDGQVLADFVAEVGWIVGLSGR